MVILITFQAQAVQSRMLQALYWKQNFVFNKVVSEAE